MNYNKKTRAELIKIAQEAEKEIRSLHDIININNGVIKEYLQKLADDEKYYDKRYAEHLRSVESLKKAISKLKNKNLIQRILNI